MIEGEPLFEVRPLAWDPPAAECFDALLVGSANAIRHAGDALSSFLDLPVHAVGESTAQAARQAGFTVPRIGQGGLQRVLSTQREPTRYLRLTGEAHVSLKARAGQKITTRIVYESAALPMPAAVAALLRPGALVLLHSAEAARHFGAECDRLGIDRSSIQLAALGSRIAAAAGTGWQTVDCPLRPDEDALLALLAEMRA